MVIKSLKARLGLFLWLLLAPSHSLRLKQEKLSLMDVKKPRHLPLLILSLLQFKLEPQLSKTPFWLTMMDIGKQRLRPTQSLKSDSKQQRLSTVANIYSLRLQL